MYYYTIMEHLYSTPDYLDTDLSEVEDCFAFKTENDAQQCLKTIFHNGVYFDKDFLGKVRYYIVKKKIEHISYEY